MKRFAFALLLLTALGLTLACGPTIYRSAEFDGYRETHHLVAVLPFQVSIDPNKLPKEITPEMAKQTMHDEGLAFQHELFLRFLEREKKGEYTVEFQDVDKTNALLLKSNITDANIATMTKSELQSILGVDAIISGTIHREKLMSTGAAIVTGVLFGFFGNTNEVNVTLNIHDAASDKLIWKYDHKASGSVGESPADLAKSLMKNVSKKFPYKKPKA